MRRYLFMSGFLGAAVLNVALWSEVLHSQSFEAAFLDVGQGDAIFLETSQGHQILIDGGPDMSVLKSLGKVMPFWDKSLDLIILTHPDADHITGLVHVLRSYKVEQVLWTGVEKNTRVFETWQSDLANEKAKEAIARKGQKISWSGNAEEFLEVLYAPEEFREGTPTNETSIISRLRVGAHSLMLTGDTTERIERLLLKRKEELVSTILKVAHHGSSTSSSREFLEAVRPETAVISVGKDNRFSHPTKDTLVKLAEYGIDTRRTDEEGTIYFYLK